MPPAVEPTAAELLQLDPRIWRACAGNSTQIPTVGSKVYYFVQGHVEQSARPPFLSPAVLSNPYILCRITAVELLADSRTDEVFAKVKLHPIKDQNSDCPVRPREVSASHFGCNGIGVEEDIVSSFAKVLTSSDANNGGGFSVPRFCADSIFPTLNYNADPPVQTLSVTDVHGIIWNFRHIYRGTPRRHLLTTGWSKFVNSKKLVAGDSVVFMRNIRGEMFVGVRRAVRSNGGSECARWSSQVVSSRHNSEDNRLGEGGREVFSRNGIGKLSAEAVAKAAELAAQFKPFEVVYYPRAGWSEFVVMAEKVDESMNIHWASGIRVKMAMETEDSSRTTWYQGSVSSASVADKGPWGGSPWRMLEITWDEAEALQNVKRVSPWEVEFATPTTTLQAPLHPNKKLRGPQKSEFLINEEQFSSMMMRFSDSTVQQFNHSLLNYNSFPAGMQGARQNLFCESRLSNSYRETNPLTCADNSLCKLNVVPQSQKVSTELLIGSSQSDDLSPDSQCSVLSFSSEAAGNQISNLIRDDKISFQLFGQIISTTLPVKNALDDGVSPNDDGNNPDPSS